MAQFAQKSLPESPVVQQSPLPPFCDGIRLSASEKNTEKQEKKK